MDCPATATFLPAVFSDRQGRTAHGGQRAVRVRAERSGEPAWRHFEGRQPDLRRARRRRAGGQDGGGDRELRLLVRLGLHRRSRDRGARGRHRHRRAEGRAVTPDERSDGGRRHASRHAGGAQPGGRAPRSLLQLPARPGRGRRRPTASTTTSTVRSRLPSDSLRRSIYVVEPRIAATEAAAQIDAHAGPAKMRVVNEGRTNAVGNPVSYEVLAANHARLLLDPQDWPARRARYLQHDLWVTPYQPGERYAAGEYVLGSRGDDGLAVWAARNRAITEPGHRGLGERRHAPPDAGGGSAGDADDLALVPAAAVQLLRPQPGDRPQEDWSLVSAWCLVYVAAGLQTGPSVSVSNRASTVPRIPRALPA